MTRRCIGKSHRAFASFDPRALVAAAHHLNTRTMMSRWFEFASACHDRSHAAVGHGAGGDPEHGPCSVEALVQIRRRGQRRAFCTITPAVVRSVVVVVVVAAASFGLELLVGSSRSADACGRRGHRICRVCHINDGWILLLPAYLGW